VVEKGPLSGVAGMLERRAAKLFLIVSVEAIQRSMPSKSIALISNS